MILGRMFVLVLDSSLAGQFFSIGSNRVLISCCCRFLVVAVVAVAVAVAVIVIVCCRRTGRKLSCVLFDKKQINVAVSVDVDVDVKVQTG
jgi:hypothetical protein